MLKINPNSLKAHEGLAYSCYREGNYGEALSHYEELVKANSDSFENWYNLGLICQKQEDYDKAVEAYTQAVRIDNESTEATISTKSKMIPLRNER